MQHSSTDILFFIDIFPTKVGGIELFAHYLGKALSIKGKNISFCFAGPANAEVRKLLNYPNISLEQLPSHSGFTMAKMRSLWVLLRRIKPSTVVYAFGGILRPLPWLCRFAGVKHIIYNDHASRSARDAQSNRFKRFIARLITYPVGCIITVSDFVAESCRNEKMSNAHCITILNGVDVSRRITSATREAFLSQHGIPLNRRIVTQLSWLVPEKGVDILLVAASEILKSRLDVHFVIGGNGAGREQYERMAADFGISSNVTFTGKIPDPISSGIFLASEIFCLASRWSEACGLVLLEAMSFGVPVVASRIGGIPEFVRDGTDGLLVAGDHKAFSDAIIKLLQNEEMRRSMGNAAKIRVEKQFDVLQMAQGYADLLTEVPQ